MAPAKKAKKTPARRKPVPVKKDRHVILTLTLPMALSDPTSETLWDLGVLGVTQEDDETRARPDDPSIRKTGSYTPPATPEMQIANAILLAGRMIEEQKFQIEQRDKLIAIAAPKAAIAARIMVSDGLFGFRQVAKKLELNERKFKQWLISNNWVYTLGGRMTVKSDILKKGFAETKDTLIQVAGEQEKLVVDMYFTSKGVHKLAQIFGVVTESN